MTGWVIFLSLHACKGALPSLSQPTTHSQPPPVPDRPSFANLASSRSKMSGQAAKNLVGCLSTVAKQNGSGVINLSKFLGEAACPESTFLQAAAQYSTTGGVAAYKLPELPYGYSALGMSVPFPAAAAAAASPTQLALQQRHTPAHRVTLSLQSLSSAARSWSCTTTSTTART